MKSKQEEASCSSGHGRNEEEAISANVENPRSEGVQEVDGKDEERSMNEEQELSERIKNLKINPKEDDQKETVGENEEHEESTVENREETTMAENWNPQRIVQFAFELQCILSIIYFLRKKLLAVGGEIGMEKVNSRVRDMVDWSRTAHNTHFENMKKIKEEASSSSSHGRNEEQESTESAEKNSGNADEEQESPENANNRAREEQRTSENVENLEESAETMRRKGIEYELSYFVDKEIKKGKKTKTPSSKRK